jgi:predicted permease
MRFVNSLRSLFSKRNRPAKPGADLDAEIRSYADHLADEKARDGMSASEARRAARAELGGIAHASLTAHESLRKARPGAWLESFAQDVRYGARLLRKSPGFTIVAVLTLALGIGANTAIFSLVNAVLLKTLPVARPSELILFSDYASGGSSSGTITDRWNRFSSEDYKYFTDHNESFKELCAFQTYDERIKVRAAGGNGPQDFAVARLVSGNFFSFLGLNPAAGRLFLPDDDRPSAPLVAVLSYAYWTAKFHADPALIGQVIQLNGTSYTIIGVAPASFSGLGFTPPEFWLPLSAQPVIESNRPFAQDPQEYWLNFLARRKPGVTFLQAQAVVNIQLKEVLRAEVHRETNEQIANSYIQLSPGAGGFSFLRVEYATALHILSVVVGIILLLACANVANLLLSRCSVRQSEISTRLAVGATHGRLIRQLLTESVLLAGIGGALGMLVAYWCAKSLVYLVLGSALSTETVINVRVLLFTAAVSMLSGALFGLVPALRAARREVTRGTVRPNARPGLAGGIVVFQIAASVVFLVSAGLFLRTLQNLANQELGYDTEHLLTAYVDPEGAGYAPDQTPALYQALIDRVEAIPGVRFATVTSDNPLNGNSWASNFAIEDLPESDTGKSMVRKHLVGPHYFATEGIPILLGRDIGPQDRFGSPLVTVINETMARKFFPGQNPIGHRFSLGAPFNPKIAMTIVGVAADARYYSLRDPALPMEFGAAFQVPDSATHNFGYSRDIEVRTIGRPSAMAKQIREAVSQVAPNLRVNDLRLQKEELTLALKPNRSAAELATAFGVLALSIACIGLYGTLAHRVAGRTREIGIRLALGAQRPALLWLVMRESALLVIAGLAFGIPVALLSVQVIASQLFRVAPRDPATVAVASIALCVVAAAAAFVPARRAMRVDPTVALRYE